MRDGARRARFGIDARRAYLVHADVKEFGAVLDGPTPVAAAPCGDVRARRQQNALRTVFERDLVSSSKRVLPKGDDDYN